jgi:hypothetical protein
MACGTNREKGAPEAQPLADYRHSIAMSSATPAAVDDQYRYGKHHDEEYDVG